MGLNVTHTMNGFQFENRENLRNAAKNILNKQGASAESTQKVLEQTIFQKETFQSPKLTVLKASTQITLNDSLKETLKYLKNQAHKKNSKQPILGELWNIVNGSENSYDGELIDFEIDSSVKNIFIAA